MALIFLLGKNSPVLLSHALAVIRVLKQNAAISPGRKRNNRMSGQRACNARVHVASRALKKRARERGRNKYKGQRQAGRLLPLPLYPAHTATDHSPEPLPQWPPPPPRSRDGRRSRSPKMDEAGRASAPAVVTVTASAAAPSPPPPPPPATATAAAADPPSPDPDALYEEGMWQQMTMNSGVTMQSGPYPVRPGEPDCTYYLRTGLCRFGMSCRFNHPQDRNTAIASARMKGEYPERVGQPECQYYLKTGTCKFGPTCKFHHPREKAGIAGMVQLNTLGYPLRPNERECAYYLKTGQCKYGNTCKFNHPEIFNAVASSRGSPIYPPVHTSGSTGPHSYTGTMASWTYPRGSFIPSPRWQSPSNYTPMIVPQGLVQVPSWNSYPGQMVPVSSPESRLQSPGAQQYYGTSRQGEASAGNQGMQSPYRSSSFPAPQYALQRENVFPERPDQPECIYYIKTGDCKFGAVCKFHHPRVRSQPPPDCILSPMGLPLRPGEELCKFYSRYGICKFGVNCKFDHPMAAPMGVYAYGYSASASPNAPMARRLLESPSGSAYAS